MTRALPSIEIRQNSVADVVVVPARSLGHMIKRHRRLASSAPHDQCYALRASQLPPLLEPEGLGYQPRDPQGWAIVLAAPSPREEKRLGGPEVRRRELRLGFHAAVHVAFELLAADGRFDEVTLRARIRDLGRAEFEEIRRTLERDEQLFRVDDDLEVYIEFAATYLELRAFAPELVPSVFPGLTRLDRIDALLASDVDAAQLGLACGIDDAPASERVPESEVGGPSSGEKAAPVGLLAKMRQRGQLSSARRAARAGRHSAALVASARLIRSPEPAIRAEAEQQLLRSVEPLSAALAALDVATGPGLGPSWLHTFRLLALRAGGRSGVLASSEAKLLGVLERAARLQMRPVYLLRVSFRRRPAGRRPLVREGHILKLVQMARLLNNAAERADALGLPPATASIVLPTLRRASERAQDRARSALRARLTAAIRRAGLKATSGLERMAHNRLVEELADRILGRGFVSLPQLRDALSRNDLKLPDVTLRRRDPLLVLDALLSRTLLGVYRRGDVYLRVLQKATSLQFGTRLGRLSFLYLLLPLGGAFTVLEGMRQLLNPPLRWLSLAPLPAPGPLGIGLVALAVLGLVHSPIVRVLGRQLLEFLGLVLAWALFRIPHALFSWPWLQRWFARPAVRWSLRHVLAPASVAAVAFAATPLPTPDVGLRLASAAIGFGATSWLMGSRLGFWLEGLVVEQLAPTWKVLGQRWLPELLRLVGRTFAALVDGLDRIMAGVDDLLRASRRPAGAQLLVLTLLIMLWAAVAYVVRFYVTLLVEPELNPLKHFPVVTVAHKLMLPFLPTLMHWVEKPFSILGPVLGGAMAGLTVFLLPSVFGFLGWELKENYRLYRATRPRFVQAARFGPDGETLRELLVPGLHSGTLPKHYERLRRAAQRHDDRRQRARAAREQTPLFSHDPELQRFRRKVAQVRMAFRRFVERELVPSITLHPDWSNGSLDVQTVDLSSNRVRVLLSCPSLHADEAELTFEALGGHLVAGCSRAGFLTRFAPEQARIVDNALAVFYHRAGVEVVREQVGRELPRTDYEVLSDGIAVYGEDGRIGLTYPIDVRWPRLVRPRVHGKRPAAAPVRLDVRRFLFAHQPVAWQAWEDAWRPSAATAADAEPRLVPGPSLLPDPSSEPAEAAAKTGTRS